MTKKSCSIGIFLSATIGANLIFSPLVLADELDQAASFLQEAAIQGEQRVKTLLEVEPAVQSKGEKLVDKLRKQLSASQSSYGQVSGSVDRTKDRLKKTETELRTLDRQLEILDTEITRTRSIVESARYQIAQAEVELKSILEEIELKKTEKENQRRLLADYLQLIYFQRNVFYDQEQAQIKPLKFLLADNSVSENMRKNLYLELMEKQGYDIFDSLGRITMALEKEKTLYEEKRQKFDALNERLTLDLQVLEEQEEAKKQLYEQTKGQEEIFRQLLIYARIEQKQIAEEIKQLSVNVDYLKERLDSLSESELVKIEGDINEFIKKNYLLGVTVGSDGSLPQFSWPVLPGQGISAYFRDEHYKEYFGIPHNALDIPVPQGTPIHAPAPGVVTSAVDAGYGYSYITLTHQDGFTTLYGHVFAINVRLGDTVHRGDIIGLSGGTPGTKGAGLLTTGPHLHFEVFKNGSHVDPLLFLPLRFLGKENLEEKYHELYDFEQEKIKEQLGKGESQIIDSVTKEIEAEIEMELKKELGED